jgi:hypothetical protein
MRRPRLLTPLVVAVTLTAPLLAQPATEPIPDPIARAVTQLRETRGHWDVTTEFLKPDGTVARTATGTYLFEWVVEDRLLRGESVIPALDQRSAILFYVDPAKRLIEMASVGKDGHLWVMTGPPTGRSARRQTRRCRMDRRSGCVSRASTSRAIDSRMEVSTDRGTSWLPGNHQVFVRRAG